MKDLCSGMVTRIPVLFCPEHQSAVEYITHGVALTLLGMLLPRSGMDSSDGCVHGGQIGRAGKQQCRTMRNMISSLMSPRTMMSIGPQLRRPPWSQAQRLEQPDLAGQVSPCPGIRIPISYHIHMYAYL